MAAEDPPQKTLLSLPGRLLQVIFSFNFPLNKLRAVTACQHLRSALAEQLKAAVRFEKAEWVILGELGMLEAADFNNGVGQFIGVKPKNRCRCTVQVDGLSSKLQNGMNRENRKLLSSLGYDLSSQEVGSRMIELSPFMLYKYHASNRGMLTAVRLFAREEVTAGGPLEGKCERIPSEEHDFIPIPIFASATKIPKELAMFQEEHGHSPLMADVGRPILLRQVVSLTELHDCEYQVFVASGMLRMHDRSGFFCHSLVWSSFPGPSVIAWVDQTDFTVDDMSQVWKFYGKFMAFHVGHSGPRPALSDSELQIMWQESATV